MQLHLFCSNDSQSDQEAHPYLIHSFARALHVSLFKGVMRDHLGLAKSDLEGSVFPESASAPALEDLIRI